MPAPTLRLWGADEDVTIKLDNGARPLAVSQLPTESGCQRVIVLADTGHDFVTWEARVREDGGTDCYWGHYFQSDLLSAVDDYKRRINR